MSKKTPDESTRPAQDPDADRTPDDTGGHSDEWTGGRRKRSPGGRDADPEQQPELDVEEDSVVRPGNS